MTIQEMQSQYHTLEILLLLEHLAMMMVVMIVVTYVRTKEIQRQNWDGSKLAPISTENQVLIGLGLVFHHLFLL